MSGSAKATDAPDALDAPAATDGTAAPAAGRLRAWARGRDQAGLADPATAAEWARELAAAGLLDLPLPGGGRTAERFAALGALGAIDPVLARLGEAHADALAIAAELGHPIPAGGPLWGVWAAEPPGTGLAARRVGSGWRLTGTKAYCSGAGACGHALVTAAAAAGPRLFAVELAGGAVRPVAGSWPAIGMAGSDSRSMTFDGAAAEPVGGPRDYTDRPGFWHGAVGVAACWYGGAVGVAGAFRGARRRRPLDAHAAAHLGAVDAALFGMRSALAAAAAAIDAGPADLAAAAVLARRVRAVVEAGVAEVLERTGRALGAPPLTLDARHGRRVTDLTVYLRQSHAERDLADLAERLADPGGDW